jgi:hypothetical protein
VEIVVRIDSQPAPAEQAAEIAKQIAVAADRATRTEINIQRRLERQRAVTILRSVAAECQSKRKPFDANRAVLEILAEREETWRAIEPVPARTMGDR